MAPTIGVANGIKSCDQVEDQVVFVSLYRLVMFQIQLSNGLEIAVAMHVSVYIYS